MINYKMEHGLQDWSNWHEISSVHIDGDPNAQKFILENTAKNAFENEKVIQSWKKAAVLKATSQEPTSFYIGFYDMKMNLFLKHELKTDLTFAMRIGPYPFRYYAIPTNLETQIKLELLEISTEDDPKYKDLILL